MGPYPLIGLDEAVERLTDQSGFYGGGIAVMDMARTDVAGDVAVSSDAAVSELAEPLPADDVAVGAPIEPAPVRPCRPRRSRSPWSTWRPTCGGRGDVDGSVFLLPAYRFIGDDGGWYTVPAVTDEFLVQVQPDDLPVPEPMPVETMPVETAPVETVPAETVPVDTAPATTAPIAPLDTKPETLPTETIPGEPVDLDVALLESEIGRSLADFTATANALGADVRVVVQDGQPLRTSPMDLQHRPA
jgi:hypothetical protein